MASQSSYGRQSAVSSTTGEVNLLAAGFVLFAAMLMLLMGSFHIMVGLAAIVENEFYVVRPNFGLEVDVSTWGWLHVVGGIVVIFAAIGLFSGSVLSRVVTLLIACLSIFWNFYSVPYYPVWSILMIVFAIGVIWALTMHGQDIDIAQER